MTALDNALHWADRGLPAFPIGIGWDATKGATSKRPLTDHGFLDASYDPDRLTEMFTEAGSRLGADEVLAVGLVPGAAGYVVFDLDRKSGKDGVDYADSTLELPTETVVARTASGGEHRLFLKRDAVPISNSSPWETHGIDIRADSGFIVAPGTSTPWGDWALVNEGPAAPVPEALWKLLGRGSSSAGSWRKYDPVKHDPLLHPHTVTTHRLLVDYFGVDPELTVFRTHPDREPYLDVTRPGKADGTSATLGYVGPDVLKVFSSGWPPFLAESRYGFEQLHEMALAIADGADADTMVFESRVDEAYQKLKVANEAQARLRRDLLTTFSAGVTAWTVDDVLAEAASPEDIRWGSEDGVLWASGEALTIVGPTGVGKSWIAQQLIRALLGGTATEVTDAGTEVLGLPVRRAESVLYLAADRPRQIKRLARKVLHGLEGTRLVMWPGSPPVGATGNPREFVEWARDVCPGVDVIVFDSLKDFVPDLTNAADASAFNLTRQALLVAGIDVLELHHKNKSTGGSGVDKSFGSVLLTAGSGSVISLSGEAGDIDVRLTHVKQPLDVVGPLLLEHDRDRFVTRVKGAGTVLSIIRDNPGITRGALLRIMHGEDPSDSARKSVNRKVAALIEEGRIEEFGDAPADSSDGRGKPARTLRAVEKGVDTDSIEAVKGIGTPSIETQSVSIWDVPKHSNSRPNRSLANLGFEDTLGTEIGPEHSGQSVIAEPFLVEGVSIIGKPYSEALAEHGETVNEALIAGLITIDIDGVIRDA